VRKLEARGGVSDPRALAATIGRRKFGSRRFQQLAAAGRRRASLRRNDKYARERDRVVLAEAALTQAVQSERAAERASREARWALKRILKTGNASAVAAAEIEAKRRLKDYVNVQTKISEAFDAREQAAQDLAFALRPTALIRRNSRPAPKFKVGDMVQGTSGRMKLFGPQRVASALYDGDMEEWTYYLPETRHAWVEGMLRSAKATPRRRTSR
jgi:hypothetical protein